MVKGICLRDVIFIFNNGQWSDNASSLSIVSLAMMTSSKGNISVLLAPGEGNPPVTGGFP